MKKQEFEIKTDLGDFQEDEIYVQSLLLMNSIHNEDVSHESTTKKNAIFDLMQKKIHRHEQKVIPFDAVRNWLLFGAVSMILICIGVGIGFYKHGYNSGRINSVQANIVVKTPFGTTTEVELPDNSIVVLNAGSKLSYPSYFQKERVVSLEGEGFFTVHPSESPFIVQTSKLSIKAVGTLFNVQAYPNEEQTFVTLSEGLIEVCTNNNKHESLFLQPNQQFILNHETGELKRQTVNTENFTAWQKGVFVFKDVSFASIAKCLERRFNVQIQIQDPDLQNEHYYASFEHNENLETILQLLSYKRNWTFRKNNEYIEIIKKNKV